MKATHLLLALAVLLPAAGEPALAGATESSLETYAKLVEELDMRRRVNVLYPNPQSLFDGLQAGFVNVGAGNLTFKRRDLVTRANGPVAFARLYDSRIDGNEDFGRGWRLALAEELLLDDAGVTYVDRSGASHRFVASGGAYVQRPATPRHARTRIVLAANSEATLVEANGTSRTFKPLRKSSSRLRIASVEAGERRLDFRYANGVLASVMHGTRTLFAVRRGLGGRIVAVTDDHGRTVRYSYTAGGLLRDVYDVAGNLWWHEYDSGGLLTAAIGANRRAYLRASYDSKGRAVESRTGREYTFAYETGSTTATEGTGRRHVFEQNRAGVTVAYSSSSGARWRLGVNADNRIKTLATPARTLEYDYDALGRVTMIAESTADGRSEQRYDYDASGRLEAVRSSGGEARHIDYASGQVTVGGADGLRYELASHGHVVAVWEGRTRIDVERDGGDLAVLRRGAQAVRFSRDALGRIVETAYPGGQTNRYRYDTAGNRRSAEYGTRGSVRYRHDPAGNLVEVEVSDLWGAELRQTTTVGDMNRVERIVYEGAHTLDIGYDRMGQPVAFDDGTERVSAIYDDFGRLARLRSASGAVWRPDDAKAPPAFGRSFTARRLATLSRDAVGASQPEYGVASFAETTFAPAPRDPLEAGVPGLAAARDLLAVAAPLFDANGDAAVQGFEKPSNPVFQPAEYRSTNCCVPYSSTCGGFCDPFGICVSVNTFAQPTVTWPSGASKEKAVYDCLLDNANQTLEDTLAFLRYHTIPIRFVTLGVMGRATYCQCTDGKNYPPPTCDEAKIELDRDAIRSVVAARNRRHGAGTVTYRDVLAFVLIHELQHFRYPEDDDGRLPVTDPRIYDLDLGTSTARIFKVIFGYEHPFSVIAKRGIPRPRSDRMECIR